MLRFILFAVTSAALLLLYFFNGYPLPTYSSPSSPDTPLDYIEVLKDYLMSHVPVNGTSIDPLLPPPGAPSGGGVSFPAPLSLDNGINFTLLPYCYIGDTWWGQTVALLQLMPTQALMCVAMLAIYKRDLRFTIVGHLSLVVWYIAHMVQSVIQSPRPMAICTTPGVYSQYGLPAPEQVLLVSTCTSTMYYYWAYKYDPYTGYGVDWIHYISVVLFTVLTPVVYVATLTSTLLQSVLSFVFAVVLTIVLCEIYRHLDRVWLLPAFMRVERVVYRMTRRFRARDRVRNGIRERGPRGHGGHFAVVTAKDVDDNTGDGGGEHVFHRKRGPLTYMWNFLRGVTLSLMCLIMECLIPPEFHRATRHFYPGNGASREVKTGKRRRRRKERQVSKQHRRVGDSLAGGHRGGRVALVPSNGYILNYMASNKSNYLH